VRLKSSDPAAAPEIFLNYLAEEEDKQAFRAGLRLTREIFAQPAFKPFLGEELSPGKQVQSDDEIDDWLARSAETAYHPCGSCRMGTDPMAVVDPQCRVHGIDNLRVVDSSIMPTVTNGNLNAPTIMIGEKGADHILGRGMLKPSDAPVFVVAGWQDKQREQGPVGG
jgi:choline dehydrogenase